MEGCDVTTSKQGSDNWSFFKSCWLQMSCVACVIPLAKRDDKVIFWCFFLSFFLLSSWLRCFFLRVMIFEMKGPNMMKNQPSQTRSSLPIWWLFAFLVYFKMFLKLLSLASAFLARNPNSSFLNNCHKLMTKKLSNLSLHFKQRSLQLFDHVEVFFLHVCHSLVQLNQKRDQVKFDSQKCAFFLVQS